ncbi:MAG: multidrug transporter AcrB [Melioribacteraceae bacterium]|nr:MAG: multidrug transporter AcrB [Melioribacteraceae bacterium]
MKIASLAIKNHQFTNIVLLLLVITGILSLISMPRSEDPQISIPGGTITIVLPGADPADLEEKVVNPIEEALNELEDIRKLEANASDGLANITIEFDIGSDPDEKFSDVIEKVNTVRDELPEEIAFIKLNQWKSNNVKIIQGAIVSDSAPYKILEEEAERLKDEIEKVTGIEKVEIMGFPEQEIHIYLDFQKIAALNIPLNRIIQSIQSENTNIPGGHISIGDRKFNIITSGSFDNISALENTIIDSKNGNILYLKDIAEVKVDYEKEKYLARTNGKNSVFITATQKVGTNIYDVMDQINVKITEFETTLPPGITFSRIVDQTESVSYRLTGFFMNLLQGLILVGFVVLLAVGIRAASIVMLAIPTSILIGIAALDLSGYGLEQMTIAGLVIALGLLVDNAIVVVENITRFLKNGFSGNEAADKATSQIGWAIVSSTVTTVLAFVPLIMMQDKTGDFIRSMPTSVVYTLTASLFVSLTFTPYLASKFLKYKEGAKRSFTSRFLEDFIATRYRQRLKFALKRPWVIIGISTIVFFGSLSLFPLVGVTFFPKAEKPQFFINITAPEGSSLQKTNSIVGEIEEDLTEYPEIKTIAANIGKGNPRIYYNVFPKHEQANVGQILVELKSFEREVLESMITTLRARYDTYAGATIEIKQLEQGPPVEAPIAIKIKGDNLEMLKQLSFDVEKMFESTEGVININNPLKTTRTDLHVNIHREKALMYGVPIHEIDRTVRAVTEGLNVSKYRDNNGKEYDILVKSLAGNDPKLADLEKVSVASVTGMQVPLSQIATIELKATPLKISHHMLQRTVTITADVAGETMVTKSTNEIINKLENYNFPKGYRYYVAGELESQQESFGGMFKAVLIAILGIFGVLVLQFRSYTQPLIVFSAIPLAIIGSIFALLITGYTFSFTAFVGITSLVGIVVNSSIILVDYTNQLRREGKPMEEALQLAAETRFTPIILTTGTTIGGLLPLTLGGGTLWAPMGWTIIGGLLMSTFLTLIVVPVLYKLFSKTEIS